MKMLSNMKLKHELDEKFKSGETDDLFAKFAYLFIHENHDIYNRLTDERRRLLLSNAYGKYDIRIGDLDKMTDSLDKIGHEFRSCITGLGQPHKPNKERKRMMNAI